MITRKILRAALLMLIAAAATQLSVSAQTPAGTWQLYPSGTFEAGRMLPDKRALRSDATFLLSNYYRGAKIETVSPMKKLNIPLNRYRIWILHGLFPAR